jgi:hypothetical protein
MVLGLNCNPTTTTNMYYWRHNYTELKFNFEFTTTKIDELQKRKRFKDTGNRKVAICHLRGNIVNTAALSSCTLSRH